MGGKFKRFDIFDWWGHQASVPSGAEWHCRTPQRCYLIFFRLLSLSFGKVKLMEVSGLSPPWPFWMVHLMWSHLNDCFQSKNCKIWKKNVQKNKTSCQQKKGVWQWRQRRPVEIGLFTRTFEPTRERCSPAFPQSCTDTRETVFDRLHWAEFTEGGVTASDPCCDPMTFRWVAAFEEGRGRGGGRLTDKRKHETQFVLCARLKFCKRSLTSSHRKLDNNWFHKRFSLSWTVSGSTSPTRRMKMICSTGC